MKFFLLSALFLSFSFSTFGQQPTPMPPRQPSDFAEFVPQYCWWNGLKLEDITLLTPASEIITVISRLGTKDSRPNLNNRRLHNVQAYWTVNMSGASRRNPKTINLKAGDPIEGLGQIEFYTGGKLIWIFKVRPNTDFNAADCYSGIDETPCEADWQKQFYPCKDKVDKRARKKKISKKRSS